MSYNLAICQLIVHRTELSINLTYCVGIIPLIAQLLLVGQSLWYFSIQNHPF